MAKYSLEVKLKDFAAAHRIIKNYQGPCNSLHGHTYMVSVLLTAAQLNSYDFVVDFSFVKSKLNTWVQDNFDHGILISNDDQELLQFAKADQQKYFLIPDGYNTSAEVIAKTLFQEFTKLLDSEPQVTLAQVTLYESYSSAAIYTP